MSLQDKTTKEHILAVLVRERGWSYDQAARLMGFTKQRLSTLILKGKRPSLPVLMRAAKELHVTYRELVDDEGRWRWVEKSTE